MPRLRAAGTEVAYPRHVLAIDEDAAAIRGVMNPPTQRSRRGLAATRRAEQGEQFAPLGRESHVVDRRRVAVALGQVLDPDEGHGRAPVSSRPWRPRLRRCASRAAAEGSALTQLVEGVFGRHHLVDLLRQFGPRIGARELVHLLHHRHLHVVGQRAVDELRRRLLAGVGMFARDGQIAGAGGHAVLHQDGADRTAARCPACAECPARSRAHGSRPRFRPVATARRAHHQDSACLRAFAASSTPSASARPAPRWRPPGRSPCRGSEPKARRNIATKNQPSPETVETRVDIGDAGPSIRCGARKAPSRYAADSGTRSLL